jgi:hypothetical protein
VVWARARATALLAGLTLACGRGAPRVASIRVVEGVHGGELAAQGLDRASLEAAARAGLAAAGFQAGQGRRQYRARLEVVWLRAGLEADAGGQQVEVAVDLELSPEGEGAAGAPVMETGVGEVRVLQAGPPAAWRVALEAAVRQAATGLALALAEERKPIQALLEDLEADDPRVREAAIRVVGDRRSPQAVPALIARLGDPRRDLADRAAGALAQIRDPRAVGPLIDFSRRTADAAHTARFARVVGDIGGAEARGYLQTLESGHADPRVRAAAREALSELEAREREEGDGAGGRSGPSPGSTSGRMER